MIVRIVKDQGDVQLDFNQNTSDITRITSV